MPPPAEPTPNVFAGSRLDRLDRLRKDEAATARFLDDPATRFLPVWRSKNAVTAGPVPAAATLSAVEAAPFLDRSPWALIGEQDGTAYVALDLSAWDEPLVPSGSGGASFADLRRMGGSLAAEEAALLAYARGLMHWRTRHRFCGACGAACQPRSAGHVLACMGCGAQHFPRTDPAVIMLVTHGGRALLGQPARFRDIPVMTTLAGFVEPGESLEEAVAREVREEAGVEVRQVRYQSSQPWPFPASIMLGFTAEALDDTLTIDTSEILSAGWFTPAQARAQDGFILPPHLSIARRLIDGWLDLAGA